MLVMNKNMSTAYSLLELEDKKLHENLIQISESGFCEKDGCVFIEKCINIETNASPDDFPDKTGYECFINSISVDDYVEDDYLLEGVMLAKKVFSLWKEMRTNQDLIAILTLDELGLKVKFHLQRHEEQLLSNELEDYEESIMVVNSSDSTFN